jgi:hypothetical protein
MSHEASAWRARLDRGLAGSGLAGVPASQRPFRGGVNVERGSAAGLQLA